MNFLDILRLALRNLREAKLRVALTVMGVLVGVCVIVSMVSFGLGLQRNTLARFRELDLFNEIEVYGRSLSSLVELQATMNAGDAGAERGQGKPSSRALDDAALAEIARLPGVVYVEPNVTITIYARSNERVLSRSVGGVRVPSSATRFGKFAAGRMIADEAAAEAVVDKRFVEGFGFKDAAAAVGAELQLLTSGKTIADRAETSNSETSNSETSNSKASNSEAERARASEERASEVDESEEGEIESVFGIPLAPAGISANPSIEGLAARRFRIVGVLQDEVEGQGRTRFRGLLPSAGIYVPLPAARELASGNRNALDEVALRLARASGKLEQGDAEGFRSATVRVDDPVNAATVEKLLRERGFNSFGLFSQIDELRIVFLVINSALALLGGISLLVASFGIANTILMAILERTREIGIMKAVGAEDGEVRLIFFVEAGVIGLAGGVLGAAAAWALTKIANLLAFKFILEPRNAEFVQFFYLPAYLWLGAILFAVMIAVFAALYPASRAARIDPVQALRHT